jgi:hypothetical protein
MPTLLRCLALAAAVATLGACVHTNAMRLGGSPMRPPVPESQVVIYRTAAQVPGRYEEIALLNSRGDYTVTNEEKMFRSMRKKASQVGANGVILDAVTDPGTAGKLASWFLGVGGDRTGRAIAIYVHPADTPDSSRRSALPESSSWAVPRGPGSAGTAAHTAATTPHGRSRDRAHPRAAAGGSGSLFRAR